uniref:DB domain-containing protein n=1 Tax=Caenorhabditis tropicalis TaxID=1561998 RepID=A0A1I7V0R3_9PELO
MTNILNIRSIPENNDVPEPFQTPPPPPPSPPVISNSGDVFARSRKEISATPDQQSGTAAATLSGSSHEWKVSILPRGQNTKPAVVNSIPPFMIDGKSDERFNKFYRTIDRVINKLDLTGDLREGEPQIRLEGSTKDLSVESSAVVVVPRTTVAPGVTNKVSVIPFRPLHFTAPPVKPSGEGGRGGPPGVSPPALQLGECGVAPEFKPCVSNLVASRSLLECCKRKNLPIGCQQLCRYDITQAEIRSAMDRGQCGIFNVAPFLECASQGKDNSECCRHRGIVQKTGPQCEQFCRPSQGLTSLGVQHIVCGNAVGDMLHCHHSGVRD